MTVEGTTLSTGAGTYTATFTPKISYIWSDGTTSAKNVTWKIIGQGIAVPSQSGTLTYTGDSRTPSWSNYDNTKVSITGTTSATDAGTYYATFVIINKDVYAWDDGTNNAKVVEWTISKAPLTIPSQNGTLTYNETAQDVSWSNYQSTYMKVSGSTRKTEAGEYYAMFTLKDTNHCWSDGSTDSKFVVWTIGKQVLATPYLATTSYQFKAAEWEPTITNFNGSTMIKQGQTTATRAGSYVIVVKVKNQTSQIFANGEYAVVLQDRKSVV